MDGFLKSIVRGTAASTILAIGVAGCGGHSSSSTAPPQPGVPVISNLAVQYGSGTCPIQGRTGRPLIVTLQYSDSDGDVRGGTLQTTGTFLPSNQLIEVNFPVPSNAATITGTTEGAITAFACVLFDGGSSLSLTAVLVDKAGHSSNLLAVLVSPEVTRGHDGHETGAPRLEMRQP
jgi:hypothetical protein